MAVELLNMDCMDYLRECPDNAFDLAVVDPPYGIGMDGNEWNQGNSADDRRWRKEHRTGKRLSEIKKGWDSAIPSETYFAEIKRISSNQIIWGGNYFTDYLHTSRGWLCWDKKQPEGVKFSDFELAWTSFDKPCKTYRQYPTHVTQGRKIHPCQKPVGLYRWLLRLVAVQGQRIIDTHLGSGSSAIAAHYFGCDFVGIEIDKDYYDAAVERFNNETRQLAML